MQPVTGTATHLRSDGCAVMGAAAASELLPASQLWPDAAEVVLFGDPRLRTAVPPSDVSDVQKVRDVAAVTAATMLSHKLVGLAANQVGESARLFCVGSPAEGGGSCDVAVVVNPKVVGTSTRESVMVEGCGSLPGLFMPVSRPVSAQFEVYDWTAQQTCEVEHTGFVGRVWLHETDHLDGIVMLDHLEAHDKWAAESHWRTLLKEAGGCPHRAQRLGLQRPWCPSNTAPANYVNS